MTSSYAPVATGNMNHRYVLTPHRLEVISYVLQGTVVVGNSLVVYSWHGFLAFCHVKVDEVPIGTTANPRLFFNEWQIVLYISLLIRKSVISKVKDEYPPA